MMGVNLLHQLSSLSNVQKIGDKLVMVCAHQGVQFISQLGKLWGEVLFLQHKQIPLLGTDMQTW